MQDLVLPSALSPADVDGTFNGSVLDLLRRKQEQLVVQATADIVACNADTFLAKKLGVEPAKAILLIEETLFDKEGTAVGFSRNYFIPDFFRFHVVRR
jgi:GntR family transcriptional regulator